MKLLALILASSFAHVAFGCSLCPRTGMFMDEIRTTSDENLLAALLVPYDDMGQGFSGDTEEVTIDLLSGTFSEGWPEGVTINPPGLWQSTPTDFNRYVLEIDPDTETASIIDTADLDTSTTFDLPDLDLEAYPGNAYGWWVSPKFERAYVVVPVDGGDQLMVAMVPIMSQNGEDVTYVFLARAAGPIESGIGNEKRLVAYEDLQIAELPKVCCLCVDHEILFFTQDTVELKPAFDDLSIGTLGRSHDMAVEYGDSLDEAAVYRVSNGHECSGFDGEPVVEQYFLTKTRLVSEIQDMDIELTRSDGASLVPLPPPPPPAYVNVTPKNFEGCIGVKGGRATNDSKLKLMKCDVNDDSQKWRVDNDDLVRLKLGDGEMCLQAGRNLVPPIDGAKLRLFDCDSANTLQTFVWNTEGDGSITLADHTSMCVVFRGGYPHLESDPIIIVPCDRVKNARRGWEPL